MPTVNRVFDGLGFENLVKTSPVTGVLHVTNNGTFSIYLNDQTDVPVHDVAKLPASGSQDIPVTAGHDYGIMVMGDVSVTYSFAAA